MTTPPASDWLEHGYNAYIFFGGSFLGFLVWIFGEEIKPQKYAGTGYKKKGRRKPKRTIKKSLQVRSPKKSASPKPRTTEKAWAKPPNYTPSELARIAELQRRVDKSRGVSFNDSWAGYGVPL